ncbi:glycosyltransferase [Sphingomicrobium sediminis]|uniref:Glycosyltransferase n=1 Tax=Sphingomicrobium sediminis TaxID=2950949 RepID=A0A9X2J2U8_9SPHN|nr:glycosyltransferase [Sphingomicrobium sediminis]MCM8557410.1 glycosyltransferase [Sphingomicrobium sediminis]
MQYDSDANRVYVRRTHKRFYLGVRNKFLVALLGAFVWMGLSIWLAQPWVRDLGELTHPAFACFAIGFIAFVPGFMNGFLIFSLLMDNRPPRSPLRKYPGITILIAAYQEEKAIENTLSAFTRSSYFGPVEVFVLNDGSRDRTAEIVRDFIGRACLPPNYTIKLFDFEQNRGKSHVLNDGLAAATHDLIITLDGDCTLREGSLRAIVERLMSDPPLTQAIAGCVMARNPGDSLIAAAQEWDYFHGIAAVKRMQSMYHGTLVAQGAFSLYRKKALEAVGGWPETVGEDIVITWAMLERGWRVGYAEDAIVFTEVPTTIKQFALQRRRWSRGLMEAFARHKNMLFSTRLTGLFIWWNLMFLPLDLAYTFIFIPGIVAAFFGHFWIVGPLTLAVLPLALLWNGVIFRIQKKMYGREGLKVTRNRRGFLFYCFVYTLIMQPVCVWGYLSELLGLRKKWGTR